MIVKLKVEGKENMATVFGILAVNGYTVWKETSRINGQYKTQVCVKVEEEECIAD